MQAVRVQPAESGSAAPYSANNPAPPSALVLDTIPIPTLSKPGQLLIRVHATTVTRDELAWPETYSTNVQLLGHDVAGTVVAVQKKPGTDDTNELSDFKQGDKVYGMLDMSKGSTWAEFAIAQTDQVALKPGSLNWAESVAVPISGLTAWQALFVKADVPAPDFSSIMSKEIQPKEGGKMSKRIAVTGAAGAIGTYVVQLAALAGLHVVAVSRSKARDEVFLKSLGASELLQYDEMGQGEHQYDIIIDTVGGETLERCWSAIKMDGILISIDSASAEFASDHRQKPFARGKEGVRAQFFIVEPCSKHLEQLSVALDLGLLKVFVAEVLPLGEAKAAYELASGRLQRRGKVVLSIGAQD